MYVFTPKMGGSFYDGTREVARGRHVISFLHFSRIQRKSIREKFFFKLFRSKGALGNQHYGALSNGNMSIIHAAKSDACVLCIPMPTASGD